MLRFADGSVTASWAFLAAINGVAQNNIFSSAALKSPDINVLGNISLSGIIDVNANDTISMIIQNRSGLAFPQTISMRGTNLNVFRIG